MSNEDKPVRKPRLFGGFTLDQIDEFVAASEEQTESFDTVSGGDLASGAMVIKALRAEMRVLSKRLVQANRNLKG
ncbi:hypothetical protein D3C87_1268490 [compost metagenome]